LRVENSAVKICTYVAKILFASLLQYETINHYFWFCTAENCLYRMMVQTKTRETKKKVPTADSG